MTEGGVIARLDRAIQMRAAFGRFLLIVSLHVSGKNEKSCLLPEMMLVSMPSFRQYKNILFLPETP